MNNIRIQLFTGTICFLLGATLVTQLSGSRHVREDIPRAANDQATYISQLYSSNTDLRGQMERLSSELTQVEKDNSADKSNLDSISADLQNLRMANGQLDVVGPGISVLVEGDLTLFEMQDLINELRNASAEAIAVDGVRVVTRSAVVEGEGGRITIDQQPLARPYRLDAIGSPDTLAPALQRKGGLIALLEAGNPNLKIQVTKHSEIDKANWLHIPRTGLDFTWVHGHPVP